MVMIKQQFDYMYIRVRIEIIWPTLIGIDCTDISNYAYSEVNSKVPRTSLKPCYCIMIFTKYMLYFTEKTRKCKRRNRKSHKR